MKHALICGVTMSGKTTFAQSMAQAFQAKGHNVIVFDPMGTPTAAAGWGEKAIVFSSKKDFIEYVERDDVFQAHIFIDEAAEIFNHTETTNNWLLTRGRHYGYQLFLIAQRPTMLPPNVRTMCAVCFMFRLSNDDAKKICQDFGHNYPEVLIPQENKDSFPKQLDTGDYLILNSGSTKFDRANIFEQLTSRGKK